MRHKLCETPVQKKMWWNTEYIPATHLGNIGARNLQDPFAEDIIDLCGTLS